MFSFSKPGNVVATSWDGFSTSKSSNPGNVTDCASWTVSLLTSTFVLLSCSSGKGFFLGLPLFPFGFGLGSIGYFLGLPLPFLTGSSGTVSVLISLLTVSILLLGVLVVFSACWILFTGTLFACVIAATLLATTTSSFSIGCTFVSKSSNPGRVTVSSTFSCWGCIFWGFCAFGASCVFWTTSVLCSGIFWGLTCCTCWIWFACCTFTFWTVFILSGLIVLEDSIFISSSDNTLLAFFVLIAFGINTSPWIPGLFIFLSIKSIPIGCCSCLFAALLSALGTYPAFFCSFSAFSCSFFFCSYCSFIFSSYSSFSFNFCSCNLSFSFCSLILSLSLA